MWDRWLTVPLQSYSLASSQRRRPESMMWHRRRRWHSEPICHAGPAKHPENRCFSHLPAAFSSVNPRTPPKRKKTTTCQPRKVQGKTWENRATKSLKQIKTSPFHCFSPCLSWCFLLSLLVHPFKLDLSDILNHFALYILKACLLFLISQSFTHFFPLALLFTPWSDIHPTSSFSSSMPHLPFPFHNHPWYLFDRHQEEKRWKSILPPASASLWLRRKERQLAQLWEWLSIHLPSSSDDKSALQSVRLKKWTAGEAAKEQEV